MAGSRNNRSGSPLQVGDHVCAFHAGSRMRRRRLLDLVRDGLDSGQRIVCVVRPDDALTILNRFTPATAEEARLNRIGSKTFIKRLQFQQSLFDDIVDIVQVTSRNDVGRDHINNISQRPQENPLL